MFVVYPWNRSRPQSVTGTKQRLDRAAFVHCAVALGRPAQVAGSDRKNLAGVDLPLPHQIESAPEGSGRNRARGRRGGARERRNSFLRRRAATPVRDNRRSPRTRPGRVQTDRLHHRLPALPTHSSTESAPMPWVSSLITVYALVAALGSRCRSPPNSRASFFAATRDGSSR